MVLGIVTGSMPMLFSLLLMQGITLTMWRTFLDRAIPSLNGSRLKKNLDQAFLEASNNQAGQQLPKQTTNEMTSGSITNPNSINEIMSIVSNLSPNAFNLQPRDQFPTLQSSPGEETADFSYRDPVINSLHILAKLDPKVLQLLSQIKNPPNDQSFQIDQIKKLLELQASLFNRNPLNSNTQMPPSMNINSQAAPINSYMHFSEPESEQEAFKYIEVSSDQTYPHQQYQNQHEFSSNMQHLEPMKKYRPEVSYKYDYQEKSPIFYEQDEYELPNEVQENEEEQEFEENEKDKDEEDAQESEDENKETIYLENDRQKINIVPTTQGSAMSNKLETSENKLSFVKAKAKSFMFGKPKISKRMLKLDSSNPLHYAQEKFKNKILGSFRSFKSSFIKKKTSRKPLSWKRNSNQPKKFSFATPKTPIMTIKPKSALEFLPVSQTHKKFNFTSPNFPSQVSLNYTKHNKNIILSSKKIKLAEIDEIKPLNCTKTNDNSKLKKIWTDSEGWIQENCVKHPKLKSQKSNTQTTLKSKASSSKTVSTSTTNSNLIISDKSFNYSSTPSSLEQKSATLTTISVATQSSPSSFMNHSLGTTSEILLSNINDIQTIVTNSSSTIDTTNVFMSKENVNELTKNFLFHIWNIMNLSTIENYQHNNAEKLNEKPSNIEYKDQNPVNTESSKEDEEKNENDSTENEHEENSESLDEDNKIDGKIMVKHRFKRICYYLLNGGRDGQLDVEQLELHICSHLIVGYARISTNAMVVAQKPLEDSEKYRRLTLMKMQYPKLKILLSIGDLGGAMFSIVASNNKTRERFTLSALDFCEEFNFDGVDIDWEFPGIRTPGSKSDRKNLILLLKELRQKSNNLWRKKSFFQDEGFNKEPFIISIAVGAPLVIASTSYIIPEIEKYVDFVNLMSYDFHYFRPDKPYTGHHSPLYPRSIDQSYYSTLNVAWAATYWANNGMSLKKIMIGVPTYARTYNLVVPIGQSMINAPANGPGIGNGKINYTEVCKILQMQNTMKHFDFQSQVPFAYRDYDWIAYENEMSVALKAQWVIKTGMGGIVTFSLNFDDSKGICRQDGKKFPLQKAISNLLELASMSSYKKSTYVMKIHDSRLN